MNHADPAAAAAAAGLDEARIASLRAEFPALHQEVNGHPLVYFDNAATTHKPRLVLGAIRDFYEKHNSNVHRGIHTLSQRATDLFDAVRPKVQRFVNAREEREIVFVRGCTEAINLIAATFGPLKIGEGDEIVLSAIEHHADIVPWQMLAGRVGATIRVLPMNERGELQLEELPGLINERTKLLGVVHVSNALGTINPVEEIVRIARQQNPNIAVLVDGAQATLHTRIDVQAIDCDFYTISGHKMLSPTGIGAFYAKAEHLEAMPPYHGGGDMIDKVTWEKTTYKDAPFKFEAGTPNVEGVIGLGAAIDYIESVGIDNIAAYEAGLTRYITQRVTDEIEGIQLYGTAANKAAILSFRLPEAEPYDIGMILDKQGIAIRVGHHCAEPLMSTFGIAATARASLSFYNTREEIDRFVDGLKQVKQLFAR